MRRRFGKNCRPCNAIRTLSNETLTKVKLTH